MTAVINSAVGCSDNSPVDQNIRKSEKKRQNYKTPFSFLRNFKYPNCVVGKEKKKNTIINIKIKVKDRMSGQ